MVVHPGHKAPTERTQRAVEGRQLLSELRRPISVLTGELASLGDQPLRHDTIPASLFRRTSNPCPFNAPSGRMLLVPVSTPAALASHSSSSSVKRGSLGAISPGVMKQRTQSPAAGERAAGPRQRPESDRSRAARARKRISYPSALSVLEARKARRAARRCPLWRLKSSPAAGR